MTKVKYDLNFVYSSLLRRSSLIFESITDESLEKGILNKGHKKSNLIKITPPRVACYIVQALYLKA